MNYIVDHIPLSTSYERREGIHMTPTFITIHNTANPSSTARDERNWLVNSSNSRQASFHIVVDEKEAIECVPLNEVAWHAGDGRKASGGNMSSIGIEICESGNYTKTVENAAYLVAMMLKERGWGVNRLRRHWDWSKKICPRLMYDDGQWTGWTNFLQMVTERLEPVVTKPKEDEEKLILSEWMWVELVKKLEEFHNDGLITDQQWIEKARKKELTTSELSWLNIILISRREVK